MKFKFKNILYISIMIILPIQPQAIGGNLKVERICTPINIANKISQPVNVTFMANGSWRLLIETVDSQIINQDNPAYSIPLSRLELADISSMPVSNFAPGRMLEIKRGDTIGLNSVNVNFNVMTFDSDRPGNYSACLKFMLISGNTTSAEEIYNFRFQKNEIATIEFPNRVTRLSLDKDKILAKNSMQNLPYPLSVYIKSNKNWKLYIRKFPDSQDKELNYFVKVLGGDQTINCNNSNGYVQITENPLLLATGKATINDVMNCLDRKLINIDYMIKGPENKFISAGEKTEEFEYRLETED